MFVRSRRPVILDHVGNVPYGDVPNVPPDYHSTMSNNHPSRSRNRVTRSPTGSEVRAARMACGLDLNTCGALIHESGRRWAMFEDDEARMHPAAWELFQRKTEQA